MDAINSAVAAIVAGVAALVGALKIKGEELTTAGKVAVGLVAAAVGAAVAAAVDALKA